MNSTQEEVKTQEEGKAAPVKAEIATTETRKPRTFRRGKPSFVKREKPEQVGKISVLGIRRVAKVGKGSKRLSFSACVVVGDMKGSVGVASGKAKDVNSAIQQAASKARKLQLRVNLYENRTIPNQIEGKFCKSKVIIRSAQEGTGIRAGHVIRAISTCLGITDIGAKVIGNRNFINVAKATMEALKAVSAKDFA